jgi:hypothetical protein
MVVQLLKSWFGDRTNSGIDKARFNDFASNCDTHAVTYATPSPGTHEDENGFNRNVHCSIFFSDRQPLLILPRFRVPFTFLGPY